MDKKARWALTDVHSEAYTQSPLACTKRCLHTIKSQELRDSCRTLECLSWNMLLYWVKWCLIDSDCSEQQTSEHSEDLRTGQAYASVDTSRPDVVVYDHISHSSKPAHENSDPAVTPEIVYEDPDTVIYCNWYWYSQYYNISKAFWLIIKPLILDP